MNKKVIIIGAGGHGKVIFDILTASGDIVAGFLDDDPAKDVLGKVSDYYKFHDVEFVIGIGNPRTRERISRSECKWYTAIHPTAVISPSAIIGEGTVVMANAVINANTTIGKHCIVNTSAVIDHDNNLSDFVHVSVGAKLGGTVCIGKNTWIGIGAVVSNNLNICEDCMVGAGAVVVKNIESPGTYYGVPASKKADA